MIDIDWASVKASLHMLTDEALLDLSDWVLLEMDKRDGQTRRITVE